MRKSRMKHLDKKNASSGIGDAELFGIVVIVFLVGFYFGNSDIHGSGTLSELIDLEPIQKDFVVSSNLDKIRMTVPAVDEDGNGLYTYLFVETRGGEGQVLINIDKLSFWLDTQESFQNAKNVAGEFAGVDGSKFDVIYSVAADEATVVGGPSAGGALAVATVFSLRNEVPRGDVVMTGTIESDGSIGQVGGIIEKAKAAKDAGAKLFLVPRGEGTVRLTRPVKECDSVTGFEFCKVVFKTEVTSIGEDVGIEVVEVRDIGEAVGYFSK